MIRQDVHLHKYGWDITLFYNAKPDDAHIILQCLWDSGISTRKYHEARMMLRSGTPNEGLTYTSPRYHCSVVVIGHVSSVWEWIDTVEHEARHLVQGICNAYGIDPDSEQAAYMEGHLFKKIVKEFAYGMGGMFLDAWRPLSRR